MVRLFAPIAMCCLCSCGDKGGADPIDTGVTGECASLDGRAFQLRTNCSHTVQDELAQCLNQDEAGSVTFQGNDDDPYHYIVFRGSEWSGFGDLDGRQFTWSATGQVPAELGAGAYTEVGVWTLDAACGSFAGLSNYAFPDGAAVGECTVIGEYGTEVPSSAPAAVGACP